MSSEMLFEGYPDPEPQPEPPEGLGADARRTFRQRQMIATGTHPATKLPLLSTFPESRTCGDCIHLWHKGYQNFSGWKCDLAGHGDRDSTDMRKWWPACEAWSPES